MKAQEYKLVPIKPIGDYVVPVRTQSIGDIGLFGGSLLGLALWGLAAYGGYHALKRLT